MRNAWLIGIGILIITGISWGLYFLINAPARSVTGNEHTFNYGPITIGAAQRNISHVIGIQR